MAVDYKNKGIWITADLQTMNWYGATIHVLEVQPQSAEIVFDIDYIFDSVTANDGAFQFWVAPCTLVFTEVYQLRVEAETLEDFQIDEVRQIKQVVVPSSEDARPLWEWEIELDYGLISFLSAGLVQYVRQPPAPFRHEILTDAERGGYSCDRRSFIDTPGPY